MEVIFTCPNYVVFLAGGGTEYAEEIYANLHFTQKGEFKKVPKSAEFCFGYDGWEVFVKESGEKIAIRR